MTDILAVEKLGKDYKVGGGLFGHKALVSAVDGCSFAVAQNEVLGLVGKSGSGKSTLARILTCLIPPDRGRIVLENAPVDVRSARDRRRVSRCIQMVFQDSYASLNPRHTAAEEVAFGIAARGELRGAAERKAREALALVGTRAGAVRRTLSARAFRRSAPTRQHSASHCTVAQVRHSR